MSGRTAGKTMSRIVILPPADEWPADRNTAASNARSVNGGTVTAVPPLWLHFKILLQNNGLALHFLQLFVVGFVLL